MFFPPYDWGNEKRFITCEKNKWTGEGGYKIQKKMRLGDWIRDPNNTLLAR